MKKQLNKSDVVEINAQIEKQFGLSDFLDKKEPLMLAEEKGKRLILRKGVPIFFYDGNLLIPTLRLLLEKQFIKKVVVDMGAVKFVAGGADIMRPGVVSFDDAIQTGDVVVVVDQTHQKPLCVARALFTSQEMKAMAAGKILKNVHFVGDVVWNML